MWSSIENLFKIPELKKRIMVTLGLLALYRVGFSIPIPGVRLEEFLHLRGATDLATSGILGFVQQIGAITGGDWLGGSLFSLGIMPYISASIIFSLLQKIVPALEQMAKEGEAGQQKLNQYSRYVTVVLCLVQSIFIWKSLPPNLLPGPREVFPTFFIMFISMTGGTIFIMWLGEQITERGIGNGISM
ncbi:MAG: preprotein translocase subunit SecY, partial [Phycisphaerae bacterium]|nr:preprotein translocase subunit SecY [Phycisphaerae bacterium]